MYESASSLCCKVGELIFGGMNFVSFLVGFCKFGGVSGGVGGGCGQLCVKEFLRELFSELECGGVS